MEMVDIEATRNFRDTRIGGITRKQRIRVEKNLADYFVKLKVAKIVPNLTVRQNCHLLTVPRVDGGIEPSALLPVAPVSPKKTAILLQARTGSSSQSTTVGSVLPLPMSSGDVMEHGGKSTTKKSKRNSKAKDGHKTPTPQNDSDLTESAALPKPV